MLKLSKAENEFPVSFREKQDAHGAVYKWK